jgi:hypothetical protein
MNKKEQWLSSKETQKLLKLTGCQLMHKRLGGDLKFKKVGNAYFYLIENKKL